MIFRTADLRVTTAENALRDWSGRRIFTAYLRGGFGARVVAERHASSRLWAAMAVVALAVVCIAVGLVMPSGRSLILPGKVLPMQQVLETSVDAPPARITANAITVHERRMSWLEQFHWSRKTISEAQTRALEHASGADRAAASDAALEHDHSEFVATYVGAKAALPTISMNARSLTLHEIPRRSILGRAGVRDGAVLRRVNGFAVRTEVDLARVVNSARVAHKSTVVLHVSGHGPITVPLVKPGPHRYGPGVDHVRWVGGPLGAVVTSEGGVVKGLPRAVSFDDASGGSSAGLMYAAGVYQALGRAQHAPRFGGTGDVSADGSVIGIGPTVALKIGLAAAAGINWFVVSEDDLQFLAEVPAGIQVIPVRRFAQLQRWMDQWDNRATKAPS